MGIVLCIVAADAQVLKHKAISIHSADKVFRALTQFHIKIEL